MLRLRAAPHDSPFALTCLPSQRILPTEGRLWHALARKSRAQRRYTMGGALETATRQLFDALDRKDAEAIIRSAADDVQAVDEISRQWLPPIHPPASHFRPPLTTC